MSIPPTHLFPCKGTRLQRKRWAGGIRSMGGGERSKVAFHGKRAGKRDGGGLAGGCEIRSARTHNTNCIKHRNSKRAQGFCPQHGHMLERVDHESRVYPKFLSLNPKPSVQVSVSLPFTHSRCVTLYHRAQTAAIPAIRHKSKLL